MSQPDLASDELGDLLARLRAKHAGDIASAPSDQPTCPALRPDEVVCASGMHSLRLDAEWSGKAVDGRTGETCGFVATGYKTARLCRLAGYHRERKRLSAQLVLCGYASGRDALRYPIGPTLLDLIDEKRPDEATGKPYAGLLKVKPTIRAILKTPWTDGGHVLILGSMGVVKSHALLSLYFSALWDGVPALWLCSGDLRDVAKDLSSFDEDKAREAQATIDAWKRRPLLFLDDLADQLSDLRASGGGTTKAAAVLCDLLNGSAQRRFISSNLQAGPASSGEKTKDGATIPDGLRQHPDIGPRATDRLFADRVIDCSVCRGTGGAAGIPCEPCDGQACWRLPHIGIILSGPSQRRLKST